MDTAETLYQLALYGQPGSRIQSSSQLVFRGAIVNGLGRHNELTIPGKQAVPRAPADWPAKLCPGSLNVKIGAECLTAAFCNRGLLPTAKSLDSEQFIPEFVIDAHAIGDNTIMPTPEMPRRGYAQVWRAKLEAERDSVICWVLRRIGSAYADQLELVSGAKLRERFGFSRDREWPVRLSVYGIWKEHDEYQHL